jgi:uncharacterized protein (UPF0212 family)
MVRRYCLTQIEEKIFKQLEHAISLAKFLFNISVNSFTSNNFAREIARQRIGLREEDIDDEDIKDIMKKLRHKRIGPYVLGTHIDKNKDVWREIKVVDILHLLKETTDADGNDVEVSIGIGYIADKLEAEEKQYIRVKEIIYLQAGQPDE